MKIDHIGIATNNINEAAEFYQDGLGLVLADIEEVADQKVRVVRICKKCEKVIEDRTRSS